MTRKADNGTMTKVREPYGGSTVEERKEAMLRGLSEEERAFLALRYELDMTNAEIGELMGVSPVSVSQRYHRLLEKCRKLDKNPKKNL